MDLFAEIKTRTFSLTRIWAAFTSWAGAEPCRKTYSLLWNKFAFIWIHFWQKWREVTPAIWSPTILTLEWVRGSVRIEKLEHLCYFLAEIFCFIDWTFLELRKWRCSRKYLNNIFLASCLCHHQHETTRPQKADGCKF